MPSHNPIRLTLILLALVAFVVTIVFNYLAGTEVGNIFKHSTKDSSDKYYLDITPAGFTFSIWGFIYCWNGLWLIYALTTCFRKYQAPDGPHYIYEYPGVLGNYFFISFILNNLFNIGWVLLWDRAYDKTNYLIWCLILIILMGVTLYFCLFLSYRSLSAHSKEMATLRGDLWAMRLLVFNGLSIYATWVSIATLLNLAHVLAYVGEFPRITTTIASDVSLSILTAEIALFFFLDNFVLDHFTRFTITPYITFVFALAGSLVGNWHPQTSTFIFTSILLAICSILFVVRIPLVIVRARSVSSKDLESSGQIPLSSKYENSEFKE